VRNLTSVALLQGIERMAESGWEADVRASQLEIYNDTVRDLLDPAVPVVDIREVDGEFAVPSLTKQCVSTAEDVKSVSMSLSLSL
jgi:hypothetical protein